MTKFQKVGIQNPKVFTSENENLKTMSMSGPELQITESKSDIKRTFSDSEHFNGAINDFYCWGQTEDDFEINVFLPNHISSTNDFKINVTPKKLQIFDEALKSGVILEGEFKESCQVDSLLWSFSKEKLQISLCECFGLFF